MDNAVYKKGVWRVQKIKKKRKSNETIILKRLRVVKKIKKWIPPSTQKNIKSIP